MQRKYLFSESSLSTSFSLGAGMGTLTRTRTRISRSACIVSRTIRRCSVAFQPDARRAAQRPNRRMFISLRPHTAGRTVGHLRPQSNGSTQRYLAPHTCLFCLCFMIVARFDRVLFICCEKTEGNRWRPCCEAAK